ncbi:MAG TPA: universal stress protein [Galbitalea sp.]|jgi:nucleotide-binding universal stress UspA family protein
MMFHAIGVGIDGSAASRFAVEWATQHAVRENSALTLLHVSSGPGRSSAETDSLIATELQFARSITPTVEPTVEIMAGDSVRALAEAADRFDVVVIGTHKTGFLRGRAFGSIGPRLAAIAPVPLAVIPAPSGRTRRGIVVGIDDDLRSLPAVRMAARDAAATAAELTVIHAQRTHGESQLGAALRIVGGEFPELPVFTREVVGDASEILINAATTAECLYIGGSDSRDGGLGPVGYDVLLNIAGPTILVPMQRQTAGASR